MTKSPKINPRQLALRVLLSWEENKLPINELLSKFLDKTPLLQARDRALTAELVFGVIRHLRYLDYLIARFSRLPLDKLDWEVKNTLRIGIYQLLHTRVPPWAALAETLKLLEHRKSGKAVMGFVNAILHRILEERAQLPEPPKEVFPFYLAVKYSFPDWLIRRWLERLGREETERFLLALNERPPLIIRTNLLKVTRENLIEFLNKEGIPEVRACNYSPAGVFLQGFRRRVNELKSYQYGWFTVQDSASQLVSYLLGPQPGERILDACAGVGGKTTHLAELTRNQAEIWAVDLYNFRLQKLEENFGRLGLKRPMIFEGEVIEILERLKPPPFDRILLDAPCSGTGIIRRHPDIKWTRTLKDLEEITQRQMRLLHRLAPYLKVGGVLVYATCSLEPEENEALILSFLEKHPEFKREDPVKALKKYGIAATGGIVEGFSLKTYPHKHNLDGFTAIRLRKI